MTLLDELKAIRACGEDNNQFAGICRCLYFEYRAEFKALCVQWPKFSGDDVFPVPSPYPEDTAASVYLYGPSKNMWDPGHPYGALRYELLDWCIEQLEK
jgi:hypothetical protein